MATIQNGMISTTLRNTEDPDISQLSLETLEHEHSDSGLQSASSAASSGRCFITKRHGYYLKTVRWVNSMGKDEHSKYEVERLLRDLHLVQEGFLLEDPSNLTPLDRNLHYVLDKLSLFAITCSKETLRSFIALVDEENAIWQARRGMYFRYFRLHEPPLSNVTYELVLLHPHQFLQKKGTALTAFTCTEEGDSSGRMYFVSPDGALREGPDNSTPCFPAFTSGSGNTRARAPEDSNPNPDAPNPFLVILHAGRAFRRFRRQLHPPPLCAEYNELINLTLELVDKIYFKPLVEVLMERMKRNRAYLASIRDQNRGATAQVKILGRNSRTGRVVEEPGPGASHDELIEYTEYLMSGCDYIDEDEDSDNSDESDDEYESDDDDNL
ncbi:hypothetical protein CVT26_015208 [Gymnopilus dilepis]|uniref:Uncharacterized protein n=1 Tax=Gymnopilus dilepis TaxID=231916 RepID=A0A409WS48_9AGAR|nr:hypothetical protein CVT26_015208 [Gymnopilus dilepis]